jgi:hypothetical protein
MKTPATYVRKQMKHESETLAKTHEKHFKNIL